MDDRKRHDSLAPKGAFGVKTSAQSERAAAKTAELIGRQPVTAFAEPFSDDEPEISFGMDEDATPRSSAELCADGLIPSDSDRVSVEDAMRALIDMRLERTRPSDELSAFDMPTGSGVSAPLSLDRPITQTMNSLAPIELAPSKAKATAVATPARRRSPLPILAAAAVLLFGVGVYRRLDHASAVPSTQPQAAAQSAVASAELPAPVAPVIEDAPTVEPQEAEPVAEFQAAGTSESDDAILTLGTPTIINVDAPAPAKPSVDAASRSAKETPEKQATVAAPRVAPKAEAVALPEAPSREAIVAGFNSVRQEVLACANGSGGVAPIEATIISNGRITHATVGGYYQGTPQGSCIARALRTARFAPFSGESIKVAFPYTL